MTDLGDQIRAARKSADLSQNELGEEIGRTSKTVRRYEQGKTQPDTNVLSLIAAATDHPIEFFLSSSSESPYSRLPAAPSPLETDPEAAHEVCELFVVEIDGSRLVETGESRTIPAFFLERVGLDPECARLMDLPEGHYDVQRHLRPSDTLLLEVLDPPSTLADRLESGRFVDGRYVVKIGTAGLQIKDLTARPDGTVAIGALDNRQQFRCAPEDQDGVTIYAVVAISF